MLTASADIYEWEYIDPNQPELGVQQSITLVPDGAGVGVLPGSDLSGLDLTRAYLPGADLAGADLTGTNLRAAHLSEANLSNADLTGTIFQNARLEDADLTDAHIQGANFFDTTRFGLTEKMLASSASYKASNLTGINMFGNNLGGWDLSGQILVDAIIGHSGMQNVDFSAADLTNATTFGGPYHGSDFRHSVIIGTFLSFEIESDPGVIDTDGFMVTGLVIPETGVTTIWIRDDDGGPTQIPIPITVQTAFDIQSDATLRFLLEDSSWGSTISFDPTVGTAHLAGTLELAMTLDDGLTPADLLGATFDLFDWTGVTIDGSFEHIVIDPAWYAAGLSLDVSQLMTTGEVRVVPLIGDLNADGFVGIDDLNTILTGWNQSVTPGDLFSGDVDGDGFIGIADLNLVLGTWNTSPLPAGDGAAPDRGRRCC